MRIGLLGGVMAGFSAMLLVPAGVVLLAGVSSPEGISSGPVLSLILAMFVPFVLCALLVGRFLAVRILTPLRELNHATGQIIKGNFDAALHYTKHDEMGDLCAAFNAMSTQLKASLEKQALLERSRKELMASISHDLRTPLSSIRGYVEGLQDGVVHDQAKFDRYIAVIKNKTESLDRLIDSLFQYTQLDLKPLDADLRTWDSEHLLDSIIQPIILELADQPMRLLVARPFPAVSLLADEQGLAQVFDNLISNARSVLREQGGVIAVQATADAQYLRVKVADNGPGISPEDMPYIFDQFYRAEKSRSRAYGGAGLGLAICRKIIQNHGGEITAEHTPGGGATFCFTLPIVGIQPI